MERLIVSAATSAASAAKLAAAKAAEPPPKLDATTPRAAIFDQWVQDSNSEGPVIDPPTAGSKRNMKARRPSWNCRYDGQDQPQNNKARRPSMGSESRSGELAQSVDWVDI